MTGRASAARLRDILEHVDSVRVAERRLGRALDEQDAELAQVCLHAILYGLVVIGEAVRGLEPEVRDRQPGIPWRDIAGMRNMLTHEYFRVSADLVARVLDEPLAQLATACRAELERDDD